MTTKPELTDQHLQEKARESIRFIADNRHLYNDGERLELISNFTDLLTRFEKLTKENEWIDVKERLPDDLWSDNQYPHISGLQNVLMNTNVVGTAAYDRNKKVWFVGGLTKELGYFEVDEPRIKVIKWRPLPNLPKKSNK